MTKSFYALDTFEPECSIGYLIKRIGRISTAEIERRFANGDLTMTHWSTLTMLQHGLASNCAGLARQIGHDSGAMTRLVDQLESRGLIVRNRDKDDRRVVALAITSAGRQHLEALTPLLLGIWNEALDSFERTEVETLINLLSRLVVAFESKEAAAETVFA